MIKATGTFKHGVNGCKDFEISLMTADDAIGALEDAIMADGSGVSMLRVRKYELARMVSVNNKLLTVAQVGELLAIDYDIANKLSDELEKKLDEPAKESPAG
jgi:hypothetical protein